MAVLILLYDSLKENKPISSNYLILTKMLKVSTYLLLYCRYGCSQNRKVIAICSLFLTCLIPSNLLVWELSGSREAWGFRHVGT